METRWKWPFILIWDNHIWGRLRKIACFLRQIDQKAIKRGKGQKMGPNTSIKSWHWQHLRDRNRSKQTPEDTLTVFLSAAKELHQLFSWKICITWFWLWVWSPAGVQWIMCWIYYSTKQRNTHFLMFPCLFCVQANLYIKKKDWIVFGDLYSIRL